ncbi:MAG: hypothetical protein AAGA09_06425 [Pseudomonadota bacterium]
MAISALSLPVKPRLIITVDTEEQFNWSAPVAKTGHHVTDPHDLDTFHDTCTEFGGAPIYFLSHPLLSDTRWRDWIVNRLEDARTAAGLHLHPWVTPPLAEPSGDQYSFQTNLPKALYQEKLAVLAETFLSATGARATSHRAGRYGIGVDDYKLLADVGVTHDFSPSTGFDLTQKGGPDFSNFSNLPFVVDNHDARPVVVTPVCGALAVPRTNWFLSQRGAEPGFTAKRTPSWRRECSPMRLTPEGPRLSDLKALTKRLLKDGAPVLSYTLHSTTLTPGATPYAQDANAVADVLETTRAYFRYFRDEIGGDFLSLGDLESLYDAALTPAASLTAR